MNAFEELMNMSPVREAYSSTRRLRAALRTFTAPLIARYVKAIQLSHHVDENSCPVTIDEDCRQEVWILKQLTWYYVIERPGLGTQQYGQRRIISELFEILASAAGKRELRIFPAGFQEAFRELSSSVDYEKESRRIVTDLISGMTEQQAIALFERLTGSSPGSVLDPIAR